MVRLVKSYFRANSLPVVERETPDIFESPVSVFPHHLKKASIAIDDLDSLSYASRKHDQDFINDLNTRVIVDGVHHGLPPRARRHHGVSNLPVASHVSRRVVVGDDLPYYGAHRGYSVPPSGYMKIGINLGSGGYETYPSRDYRRHSLADTAVRHAHREVDRVQRELANQEDPYFAALKRTPIPVAKYRSVYAPRSSSVSLAGIRSVTPPPLVTSERPSYYHYYYHREQPLPDYDDGYYRKRSLYSPISLVRCLTASPVVPLRSHSPVSSRYESHIQPIYHSAMTSQPSTVTKVRRSSSYHGPRHYRSSSSYTLPDSVGQWYYRTPHVPLESSFRYGSVPYSSPHLTSYVKYSSPPPAFDYSTGPQPPYHSRVYTGPARGNSSSYSYSYNSSGLPPVSPHSSYGYHHYRTPVVSQSYVTHPPRVTKTVYTSSSSSGHAPASHIPVSDTRKKVRDVLCKVKKDPTYFDD